jgi:hypothetical protein
MQGKGFEPLDVKINLIFLLLNNRANHNRAKYLLWEGDSDSYLLTNLMVPYLLQNFFDSKGSFQDLRPMRITPQVLIV